MIWTGAEILEWYRPLVLVASLERAPTSITFMHKAYPHAVQQGIMSWSDGVANG